MQLRSLLKCIRQYRRVVTTVVFVFLFLLIVVLVARVSHMQTLPTTISIQGKDPRTIWQREITNLSRTKGVAYTLSYVASRSRSDIVYQSVCHELMHVVGHEAYSLFLTGKYFLVTSDASACLFGFYHGVMESWIGKGGDKVKAIAFCDMVDRTPHQQLRVTYNQCWHGIGHGAVVPHERKLWGNMEKMVKPALMLCTQMATSEEALSSCTVGAYAGIAMFTMENQYGLELQSADPLALCEQEKDQRKKGCIGGMMPALFKQHHHDMTETWSVLLKRLDKATLDHAANALGSSAATDRMTPAVVTVGCERMGRPFASSCLVGYKETQALL